MRLLISATIFCAAFLTACAATDKNTNDSASTETASPSWQGRMQQLNVTISDLIPYVFDDRQFYDPKNFSVIEEKTKAFASLAHGLDQTKKGAVAPPSSDPALAFFSTQFQSDLQRAQESLTADHRGYAQSVLKTSISYCVSCHTRTDSGPKYNFQTDDGFVKKLRPLDRAKYYTAVRQYESALKEYLGILENPAIGRERPFDVERAARGALAISVRVNKDPKTSKRIAEDVIKRSTTPLFVKSDAESWVKAINEWQTDSAKLPSTEAGFVSRIKSLINKANSQQRYSADMRGDIYYLLATSLVHDYFQKFPNPKNPAEMFYLAGMSYQALRELGFWTIHEMYFERCIRQAPHSPLARTCYEQFEQSVLLGYSGSGGLFLPAAVGKQLLDLRALATAK